MVETSTRNSGYRVGRYTDAPKSLWTLFAPDGHNMGSDDLGYLFETKREATAYLLAHDLDAERAERARREQARKESMERSLRIQRHPLYTLYWAYKCAWEGLKREIERIEKDAARPQLSGQNHHVLGLALDLRRVGEEARTRGHAVYTEMAQDVDAQIAREKQAAEDEDNG